MKYPIGIQDFEKIRQDGYLYIDKTEMIYQLAQTGSYYFLSRPRRFGKSLLVSTLKAYFEGKRELFRGLAMERLEQEWAAYPVLHLDLNIDKYDTPESVDRMLNDSLTEWEQRYGSRPSEVTPALRFAGIVRRAYETTGKPVVVLVDEYDKPMLQAIGDEALQEGFRSSLKPFYGVLKTMDRYIKFALLTGVTKFGKVSVFSDLNNLEDISMNERFVGLCGITEREIHEYMEPELHELAAAQGLSYEEACGRLKEMYDGYHFAENTEGIYNPFSLLNTFKNRRFGSYWFETGTPTYLVELLKKSRYNLQDMTHVETDADVLNSIHTSSLNPIPVIYQSGYLTIKGYDKRFGLYALGFPNEEVEAGFMKFLLPFYANTTEVDAPFQIRQFVREVEGGDVDAFLHRMQSFFADLPYEITGGDLERHYQNVLFIVFKLMGLYTQVEYHTSEGRIDLVLQTPSFVYVMEFKLDGTAQEAMDQINEKRYALPFAKDSRKVLKVGVNFSAQQRNIEHWLVEPFSV